MSAAGPSFRFPHPLTLLVACILVAAALTWVLPAGQFERREDPVTGRSVVVAGTYAVVNLFVDLAYSSIDPRIRYD